jgi:hypothetical protein
MIYNTDNIKKTPKNFIKLLKDERKQAGGGRETSCMESCIFFKVPFVNILKPICTFIPFKPYLFKAARTKFIVKGHD